MSPRKAALAAVAGALLLAGGARAQDDELDLIPAGKPTEPEPPPPADAGQRIYLEDAFTLSSNRAGLLVPSPPPAPFDWQERLLLDIRTERKLGEDVGLVYSGRLNLRAENDIATPSHEEVVNDLREAYLAWRPGGDFYLDLGRINLKSGTALGFNPTDFFKTRSVVEPLSADPTVLREDRLGTLMARGQYIAGASSLTVAVAPAVTHETPIYDNLDLHSLDPSFDRTNAADRFLLKGSIGLSDDVSPEVLLYREGGHTSYGLNLADNFGQSVVGYLEWSGSRRPDLIEAALAYGHATNTLPAGAPALPGGSGRGFRNALSTGFSYTTENKITINLEYHFDQASFTHADWRRWFAAGVPAGELWYLRGYAQDQQEPISRHSAFLRADWVDAVVPDLELTAFANTDLYDGSSLIQATAAYYLSSTWTVGAQVSADAGGRRTDFGSLPQAFSTLLQITRYF